MFAVLIYIRLSILAREFQKKLPIFSLFCLLDTALLGIRTQIDSRLFGFQLDTTVFTLLFDDCGGRGEIIATFLALLEMVRDGALRVEGNGDEVYLEIVTEEE